MDLKRLIAVARGDIPADLLLTDARIVNTFTGEIGEIEEGNVAVFQGRIAGVGGYTDAKRTVDLKGRYLAPGLIDGHIHIESFYLHVDQYALAVVPHGTLAVVTDLHEVANVSGLNGMRYIMDCGRKMPLDIFFMSPPCVPSTDMETSGATLGPDELRQTMRCGNVIGMGEMMNFPGVINGADEVVAKIEAVGSHTKDGHAPEQSANAMNVIDEGRPAEDRIQVYGTMWCGD